MKLKNILEKITNSIKARIVNVLFFIFKDIDTPNTPGGKVVYIRNYLLKMKGGRIGRAVNLQPGINFYHSYNNFSIGNNSGIGRRSSLHLQGKISIGNDVMIGQELIIHTSNHHMENNGIPMWQQSSEIKDVTIGDNVWIGSRVTILPGVNVGNGVVIGAGSIVTKNLEHNGVYAGNPAMLIKKRS